MFDTRIPVIITALSITACGAPHTEIPPTATAADGGAVEFNIQEISAESRGCAESERNCARVTVSSLETTGGGTDTVRENIDLYLGHDLVSRMRAFLPEDVGSGLGDVDDLAAAFLATHREFVVEFPNATAAWTIEITATALYNTPIVATIDISEFAYTGGAHPNSRRRLVSFDVSTGQLLGIDDLTTDVAALTALVEDRLYLDRDLGHDGDLEAAGFWIPEGGFTLPDNIGVVAEGLLVHWDAYEIAPYSMGPIDVTIPSADLHEITTRDFW